MKYACLTHTHLSLLQAVVLVPRDLNVNEKAVCVLAAVSMSMQYKLLAYDDPGPQAS